MAGDRERRLSTKQWTIFGESGWLAGWRVRYSSSYNARLSKWSRAAVITRRSIRQCISSRPLFDGRLCHGRLSEARDVISRLLMDSIS